MEKNIKYKIIFEISIIVILYILSVYGIYYLVVRYSSGNLSTVLVILLPYILVTAPFCVYGYNLRYRRIYDEPESSEEERLPIANPKDILQILKVALFLLLANVPLFLGIYTIAALKRPGLGVLIVCPSAILLLLVHKILNKVLADITSKFER